MCFWCAAAWSKESTVRAAVSHDKHNSPSLPVSLLPAQHLQHSLLKSLVLQHRYHQWVMFNDWSIRFDKKYNLKHTNPNTRADKHSEKKKEHSWTLELNVRVEHKSFTNSGTELLHHGWHMSGQLTWLHSETEFLSGSRALAVSKISSILSRLAPSRFQNFFKICLDCYQASPTITQGPMLITGKDLTQLAWASIAQMHSLALKYLKAPNMT